MACISFLRFSFLALTIFAAARSLLPGLQLPLFLVLLPPPAGKSSNGEAAMGGEVDCKDLDLDLILVNCGPSSGIGNARLARTGTWLLLASH